MKQTLDLNSNKPGSFETKGRSIARSSDEESPKPESYELFPDFQGISFVLVLIPLSVVIISSDGTFQYSSEDSDIGSIVLKIAF